MEKWAQMRKIAALFVGALLCGAIGLGVYTYSTYKNGDPKTAARVTASTELLFKK